MYDYLFSRIQPGSHRVHYRYRVCELFGRYRRFLETVPLPSQVCTSHQVTTCSGPSRRLAGQLAGISEYIQIYLAASQSPFIVPWNTVLLKRARFYEQTSKKTGVDLYSDSFVSLPLTICRHHGGRLRNPKSKIARRRQHGSVTHACMSTSRYLAIFSTV